MPHLCCNRATALRCHTVLLRDAAGLLLVDLASTNIKLRNSEVSSTENGIVITGPGVDLGTINDLGNNFQIQL
jgi:hypothetical protein